MKEATVDEPIEQIIQTAVEEIGLCAGHVLLAFEGARAVLLGPERRYGVHDLIKGARGVPKHGLQAARALRLWCATSRRAT
jgi:hypothetical protein